MKTRWNKGNMGRRRFLKTAAASGFGLSVRTPGSDVMSRRFAGGPRFDRCIVLGMDGLDPRIVAALMRQDRLPNFAGLAKDGTFGPLQTSNPAMSPVAWSNIATGAGPAHHGIFDFLHRDPKHYMPYISLRKSSHGVLGTRYEKARQVDGFWRYTSDAGLPTTILRWPVTFPPENVSGRFLSGLGVPDLLGTEGQYTFFTTEPIADDDPSPHNVVHVRPEQAEPGTVRAVLKGPMIGRGRAAEVPLIVKTAGPDIGSIQFDGEPAVELRCRQWTPWIEVTFKTGLRRIHGMVKLLLLEIEPRFRLLASPINLDPGNPAFDLSCPAKYARSLRDRIGVYHTLGMPELVHPLSHRRYGFYEFLAQVGTVRAERKAMFMDELGRFDKGVFAFVFDHTDRIQHAFWATRDPGHPTYNPVDVHSYRQAIEDTYVEMDACLGEATRMIDGSTLLLTISDHGFGSFRRQVHLNRWLIDNGLMRLKGTQEVEGRGLFQDVDWDNTTAYAAGFSSIYLNLVGREGRGSLTRGKKARELLKEMSARLLTLTDPGTDKRVIRTAYLGGAIYTDGPLADKGPDIVVGYEPGYRGSWQTALGGAPDKLLEDNESRWSGDHIFDPDLVPGIVLSNAKLLRRIYRGIDIAPTILGCFGIVKPGHMMGRNLLVSA